MDIAALESLYNLAKKLTEGPWTAKVSGSCNSIHARAMPKPLTAADYYWPDDADILGEDGHEDSPNWDQHLEQAVLNGRCIVEFRNNLMVLLTLAKTARERGHSIDPDLLRDLEASHQEATAPPWELDTWGGIPGIVSKNMTTPEGDWTAESDSGRRGCDVFGFWEADMEARPNIDFILLTREAILPVLEAALWVADAKLQSGIPTTRNHHEQS